MKKTKPYLSRVWKISSSNSRFFGNQKYGYKFLGTGFVSKNKKTIQENAMENTPSQNHFAISFEQFLQWEAHTRDVLDVKKMYIDLAEDLAAGVALSHILFWYLPSKRDEGSKLRVYRDGHYWIAVPRSEWWERCRLTEDQADRALKKLIEKGLIEKKIFKFNGSPVVHIRLQIDTFLERLTDLIQSSSPNPNGKQTTKNSPECEMEFGNSRNPNRDNPKSISPNEAKPLTETTNNIPLPPPPHTALQELDCQDWGATYPQNLHQAINHPDLILFKKITNGLMAGESDWQKVIDRIQYIRQKYPGLDDEGLCQAGKKYWQAWVERGHSPTHPIFLEWWMNELIPQAQRKRSKHKKQQTRQEVQEQDLETLRKKGRDALSSLAEDA